MINTHLGLFIIILQTMQIVFALHQHMQTFLRRDMPGWYMYVWGWGALGITIDKILLKTSLLTVFVSWDGIEIRYIDDIIIVFMYVILLHLHDLAM